MTSPVRLMIAWLTFIVASAVWMESARAAEEVWDLPRAQSAWNRYLQEVARVEGRSTTEMIEYNRDGSIKHSKTEETSTILWCGIRIRIENDILVENGKFGALLQNAEYAAHAFRERDDEKSWRIKSILPVKVPSVDIQAVGVPHPSGLLAIHVLAGLYLLPESIPRLMSSKEIIIEQAKQDVFDDTPVVSVKFRRPASGRNGDVAERGVISFMPNDYWLVRHAELHSVYRWDGGEDAEDADISIEYNRDNVAKLPLPVLYSVKSRMQGHQGKGPSATGLIRRSQFSIIDPKSYSDAEFRLTRYGLPEPVIDTGRKLRWWAIIGATGIGLMIVWWLLNRRRQSE